MVSNLVSNSVSQSLVQHPAWINFRNLQVTFEGNVIFANIYYHCLLYIVTSVVFRIIYRNEFENLIWKIIISARACYPPHWLFMNWYTIQWKCFVNFDSRFTNSRVCTNSWFCKYRTISSLDKHFIRMYMVFPNSQSIFFLWLKITCILHFSNLLHSSSFWFLKVSLLEFLNLCLC